jgi:group I intron endonuclease
MARFSYSFVGAFKMVKTDMKQRWGCVYKFTNKINKKIYIGKTINWKQRKCVHKYSAKKPTYAFAKALKKHGWENFKREILISDVPEEDLSNLENCYIEVYNSTNPEIGYNMSQTKNHTVEGGGAISFCNTTKKWLVRGKNPEVKHVGLYFTKEKAEKALALYNQTGESMPSDIERRKIGTGSITFNNKLQKWQVRGKGPEYKNVGLYYKKEKAEKALDLYNITGDIIPSDTNIRKHYTGSISFNKKEKKWLVRGKSPEQKFVGRYLTKEKSEEALDLYNQTGECIPSDIKMRQRGTGSIRKRNVRYEAVYKRKYVGTFDTKAEAEEALEKLWRD